MNDHAPQPVKSTSRWSYFFISLVVLFAGLLIAWFYLGHHNEQVLQAMITETNHREPEGWQLEDLERRRRSVSDEDNLGLLLFQAKTLRPKEWMYWDGYGPRTDDDERSDEVISHLCKMEELAPNRRLSYQQFSALRNEVCRGEEYLVAIRKGTDKTWGRYPISFSKDGISTLLPFTQDAREYCNALCHEATLRADLGTKADLDLSLDSCRRAILCNRAIGDEPTLISVLVRIAIRARSFKKIERIVAQGEPSPEALAQMQKLLEEDEAENMLIQGARGERALMDRMMLALQRGDLKYADVRKIMTTGARSQLYGLEDWAFWATAGSSDLNRAAFLKLNNRFVEIAEMPVEDMTEAVNHLSAQIQHEPKFVRSLFPAVIKVTAAYRKITAQSRAMRVLLAAERFRQQQGRWPEKLSELVPEFLDKVPLDPYDGQPLRWTRKDDGWVIYSVSTDGTDDGGNLSDRSMQKGVDLGFRLYDPDQRRLPYKEPELEPVPLPMK